LNAVEKCAGRKFRAGADTVLAASLLDFPDSAPCSVRARFYRHECSAVKGRTRAIRLDDRMLASPEIWVTAGEDGNLEALFQDEAQRRLELGAVAEYQQVLAGKFTFTWKHGKCGHCGLAAISREGVLADARPATVVHQDDLASPAVPAGGIKALKREVGM